MRLFTGNSMEILGERDYNRSYKCPECGSKREPEFSTYYCQECEAEFELDYPKSICPECGGKIVEIYICPDCGTNIES